MQLTETHREYWRKNVRLTSILLAIWFVVTYVVGFYAREFNAITPTNMMKWALIEPRELILVDEPTKGLAPAIIANMIEAFRELKRTDTTILVVEQNFHFARSLGDTVAVMDSGRIVHTGAMAALAADEALQTRLLGLSLEARP